MTEYPDMSCAELSDVAAELALGVLTGRERARAVAHLDRCEGCREDVRQLMQTGEGLLALLPEAEPSAGFETRVLARLNLNGTRPVTRTLPGLGSSTASGTPPVTFPRKHAGGTRAGRPGTGPRKPMSRRLAVAAVVLAIAGAGATGWGLGMGTASRAPDTQVPAPAPALASASFMTAGHQNVGQLFVYQGSPRWLYMSVDMPSGNGWITCEVVGSNGTLHTIGKFRLSDGYGNWGSPDPDSFGVVTGARLVAADGTVLATATLG